MTSLNDLIKQYGALADLPAIGDKVLFERGGDSGSFSINLGEVTEIRPEGEFKEPTATVRGIHTFYPDGSHKRFRGRTHWAFPVNHFTKPIGERLGECADRWEKLSAQARAWTGSFQA